MPEMTQEERDRIELWIAALESDNYHQGTSALIERPRGQPDRFCCLGVLCDISPNRYQRVQLSNGQPMVTYCAVENFEWVYDTLPNQGYWESDFPVLSSHYAQEVLAAINDHNPDTNYAKIIQLLKAALEDKWLTHEVVNSIYAHELSSSSHEDARTQKMLAQNDLQFV